MKAITIELSDEAAALAERHAKALGYEDAADWAHEWLRNTIAQREDDAARSAITGGAAAHAAFGKSKREQASE